VTKALQQLNSVCFKSWAQAAKPASSVGLPQTLVSAFCMLVDLVWCVGACFL